MDSFNKGFIASPCLNKKTWHLDYAKNENLGKARFLISCSKSSSKSWPRLME